jgi:hypothetical protein
VRFVAAAGLVSLLYGCPKPAAVPAFPHGVRDIAVLQTSNQTGDLLRVEQGGVLNLVFSVPTVTVPEILDGTLREELRARGFTVTNAATVSAAVGNTPPTSLQEAIDLAKSGSLAATALFLMLQQWEPALGPTNNFVNVAFEAWLIEAPSGRIIWTYRHPLRPVLTQGMPNVGEAYAAAARRIADELVANWQPSDPK